MEENEHKLASFSYVTPCVEKVNKGNDVCSMNSQGEKKIYEQNMSTVHAIVEQSILGHSSSLTSSSDDCLVPCDKKELCDDNAIIYMPQNLRTSLVLLLPILLIMLKLEFSIL